MAKCIKCGCDDPAMTELITSQAVQMSRLNSIDKKLDRLVTGVYGPENEPEKGLVVRVDRLEQTKKGLLIGFWTIFSGVVALVLNALAGLFDWK